PWLSFVICTSDGLIQLDESAANFYQDGEDTPENGDTVHSYTSCPYATAAPLASAVATLDVVLYAVDFSPTVFHAVDPTLVHKDLFQRKRSRAPPFLTS
ncbi:MAG: hypothetical protein KUG61_06260, partial [Parvibaculaceae bacterium]|nr:hypothetical protein [Parvibaculaceae bacterium]